MAEKPVLFDQAQFARLARHVWFSQLAPRTQGAARCIFEDFEREMAVDPFALLLEARKTQSIDLVLSNINRYYGRLVARGLSAPTARQYCVIIRGFFNSNRLNLPRSTKAFTASPSLQGLFAQ